MDKDRLKKVCTSALDVSFPGLFISEFVVIPTFKYDDSQNEWVSDSHTIFVQVKRKGENIPHLREVETFLESLFGLECCVDFS